MSGTQSLIVAILYPGDHAARSSAGLSAGRFAVRHAQRGSAPEEGPITRVLERLAPYFADGGHMIDQAWQPRLTEGMVRAYLVQGRVAGFGHQAINALYPATGGEPAPQPGPRLYSGPDDPRLRRLLEDEWVGLLREHLDVAPARLPLLWDADFLLGGAPGATDDRYVLCEINVSSVWPLSGERRRRLGRSSAGALAEDALNNFLPSA